MIPVNTDEVLRAGFQWLHRSEKRQPDHLLWSE